MKSTRLTLSTICALTASATVHPVSGQDNLLPVVDVREYEHVTTAAQLVGDRVVFSKYAEDGNNEEIISIDPFDGSAESLVAPARGARLIASDERYIIYSTAGTTARPVVVADRATGRRLASVRLRDGIVWGHIRDDRLILIQGGRRTGPALIYRLPELELERSTEVIAAQDAQLWGEQIVLLGRQLAVYDLDLNPIAVLDLPPRYPDINAGCTAQPLRIYRNLAIVGSRCYQLAVYDLSTRSLRYVLRGFANYHGFDVIDDLLFVTGNDTTEQLLRVYDVSSGREITRLSATGQVLAASDGRLLTMKRDGFSTPARVTLYEPALDPIRSETARLARVLEGCTPTEPAALHETIDRCESAGVRTYLDALPDSPELTTAVRDYARWLALSYSRFDEAIPILEALDDYSGRSGLLTLARAKAAYLDLSDAAAPIARAPDVPGVRERALDFGAFSNLIAFDGHRAYVARYACPVTLDVLDRDSFALIERVVVTGCDDDYQDNISSIHLIPGYIVLGLSYRYEDVRPNVAVVATDSLKLLANEHIAAEPESLRAWNGRLLRCATRPGEPHTRFDPLTARLVEAASDEAIACLNGDVVRGRVTAFRGTAREQSLPLFSTPRYRVYDGSAGWPTRSYRFVAAGNDEARVETTGRPYIHVLGVPNRDAVVLSYARGREWIYLRFDVDTQTETTLLHTNRVADAMAAWRSYLFVAMGRHLLTYDLEANQVVYFERDFIREGNGIRNLLLDGDRLIVLPLRGENTRVIDLPLYATNFHEADFFADLAQRQNAQDIH